MKKREQIRCRVAACREALADGQVWSFYLINDCDDTLDSAMLYRISSEWGDFGNTRTADVHVSGLAPGARALIWRDDGEFRTELSLLARLADREVRLSYEFPKLYIQRNLPFVDALGKQGWVVAAQG